MSTTAIALDILTDSAANAGRVSAPMRWLHAVRAGWMLSILRFLIVRDARSSAREVEKNGLSLSGMANRLAKHASGLTDTELEHCLKSAVRAEAVYLNMRSRVMELLAQARPYAEQFPDITEAFSAWIEALADAFESAQELRWVVLECQAQADVDAAKVQRYGTAQEAIAALRA
jgi:hypothetical protein